MPLMIRAEGGLSVPVVVCDHCGQEIDNAREGNYQWKMPRDADRAPDRRMYFTHKVCCHDFEQSDQGDFHWAAIPLECLPVFLGNNLKLDWAAAKDTVRLIASV